MKPEYTYRANLVRVIDGDTVVLDVDCGFHMRIKASFRLFGINAPEMRGDTLEAAKIARDALSAMIPGGDILIKTHKEPDKYGRWLVEIMGENGRTVNERMVIEGFAKEYML